MNVPARDSRYIEDTSEKLVDDRPMCINCALPQPEGEKWHWIKIVDNWPDGALIALEEWPICPDCATSRPSSIVQYVRFKVS